MTTHVPSTPSAGRIAATHYATSMPNCPITVDAVSEASPRWVTIFATCSLFVPSEEAQGRRDGDHTRPDHRSVPVPEALRQQIFVRSLKG